MTALRLGTRGSLLALAQSNWTASALEANGASEVSLEVIRTVGDEHLDQPLHEISGKGLFTRERKPIVVRERQLDAWVYTVQGPQVRARRWARLAVHDWRKVAPPVARG